MNPDTLRTYLLDDSLICFVISQTLSQTRYSAEGV